MIYRLLNDFSDESCCHPRLKDAITFLRLLLKKSELPNGKYVWDKETPDDLFANVQSYRSKDFQEGVFESHKKYIDLQYVVSGEEYLYVPSVPTDSLKEERAYNKENDCSLQELLQEKECIRVLLNAGNYVILFPNEAHAPGIATANGKADIKKIVLKVRYS